MATVEAERVGEAAMAIVKEAEKIGEAAMAIVKEAERVGEAEIEPIQGYEAGQMCFSQLREGLVKKAIKFYTRTGAEFAIVVFSPAGKPYSFGNPSVNAIIDRYCGTSPAAATAPERKATTRQTIIGGFDSESERLLEAIAAEARRRDELDEAARAAGVWTSDNVVRGWGTPRLVATLAALERVQAEVAERAREMDAEEAMVPWYAKAMGGSDAFHYDLGDDGSFSDRSASSSHQGGMDTQTVMLLGSDDVGHEAHAACAAACFSSSHDNAAA